MQKIVSQYSCRAVRVDTLGENSDTWFRNDKYIKVIRESDRKVISLNKYVFAVSILAVKFCARDQCSEMSPSQGAGLSDHHKTL